MKLKRYSTKWTSYVKSCLIAVGLSATMLGTAQDVTTGLILHYDFENMQGTAAGTTLTDKSGTGNNGTIQGALIDSAGYAGRGLYFATKNDYIKLPENITSSLKSFTYATWAYFTTANNARLFDFGNTTDDNNPSDNLCFMPNNANGKARMRYRATGATVAYNVDATTATPVGQWAHIAVTFKWDESTSAGTATIYINGVACGTSTFSNFNPSLLGTTAYNFIGRSRWAQDSNGLNAVLDDVRLYNRALTSRDIMTLIGYSKELQDAQENLTLNNGDLSAITSSLTLPTTADGGISITWASSNKSIIDTLGNVTRPEQYDATVVLTATLTQLVGNKTYSLAKSFTAVVKAQKDVADQLAKWSFTPESIKLDNGIIKVTDESESGFVATVMNDAHIRTIGKTDQYNVLDLGNGTGYLDMGTEIGKAIYSLNNYTMCGFFRIAGDYAYINSNGNFYWTFSNTADAMNDPTGYIIGSLKETSQSIATGRYDNGNQAVSAAKNAAKGAWHHFAYTQKDNTGTLYVDGQQVATGTISNLPSLTLPKAGKTGTLYNWLGRSNYTSDCYLRKTMLYDFELWRDAMTADDLNYQFGILETLDKLNNAVGEDSSYVLPELTTEMNALTLDNLSSVTSNLTFPVKGSIDPTIAIAWKSSIPSIIDATGNVTRPDMYPAKVKLTAVLFKSGQSVTKSFDATVKENEGTGFASNLLVKYDFANVADTVVTDAAEKHFKGALVNHATIRPIGESTIFPTLDLTDSTAYFDMSAQMGSILYNLKDYTMSCYYRVDESNTWLGNAGNFLWTFSNSTKTGTDQNGCLFGGLRSQTQCITPKYWSYGEQTVSAGLVASTGGWHNFTYVQKDTIGTIYLDGVATVSDTVTWLPSNTLPTDGRTGTNYNWLGRSPYVGDAYLSKALLYDFRIYNKALTDEQIQNSELNVAATINALETAWIENPNIPASVKSAQNTAVTIYTTANGIRINGLTGNEKVSLFDLTGRQIRISNPADITISRGLYLVKVDHNVTKVFVR